MATSSISCLEPELGEAIANGSTLPASARAEFVGLFLIAKAEKGMPPQAPPLEEGCERPVLPPDEVAELEAVLELAYKKTCAIHGESDLGHDDLLHLVGEQLCPKAAPIPPDAFRSLYTLCNTTPYVIQIDEFLKFPGPGFHFSMSRVLEAKRQSWELIRSLQDQGKCERLLLMAGNPAVGKSTWVQTVGLQEPDLDTCVFFDDLLNNKRRRGQWWEAFRSSGLALPIEIVAVETSFERAMLLNRARGAKGGHEVPLDDMMRYQKEYEPPSVAEGFPRVRVFENEYDEATGKGGYVLKHQEFAASPLGEEKT